MIKPTTSASSPGTASTAPPLTRIKRDTLHFFNTPQGFPSVRADPEQAALSSFLSGEIQRNTTLSMQFLTVCKQIKKGKQQEYGYSGNLFALDITTEGVQLSDLYGDGSQENKIHLDDFIHCLQKWHSLIGDISSK